MDRPSDLADRFPAEPDLRSITPAPEDYAACTPLRRLWVPLGWMALLVGLVVIVSRLGWPAWPGGHV